ncbi:MAG: FAD:protein FMN transferase [Blastocatellia bacterium]
MESPAPLPIECHRACEVMGTRFEVFLRGTDAAHLDAVAVAVCEEITRLDSVLSRFDPRSEIARVNREAASKPMRVDRELFALLESCEAAQELTAGYFDVTRCAALALDVAAQTVRLTRADARIDLGAIGKGYALDAGREICLRFGVTDGLLQGGTSSVLAMGETAWPLAVRHPLREEDVMQRLTLTNQGFSCSAVRHAAQSESDVINPLTGAPLVGDDACVVLAASATEAEIYSTALLAMGCEGAKNYLAQRPDLPITMTWFAPHESL